jgi:hypothetical protein
VKKLLTLIITLSVSLPALSNQCSNFEKIFNKSQQRILSHAYAYGKPYGLEYSLTAIAWEESSAGEVLLNPDDPSAGIYQNHVVYALKREGIKNNYRNRSDMLLQLATNEIKATAHGLSELLHWTHTRDSWKDVWASYNGGKNYRGSQAKGYALKIYSKIKMLKKCPSFLNIHSISELDMKVFDEVKRLSKKSPKKDILKVWSKLEKISKKANKLG